MLKMCSLTEEGNGKILARKSKILIKGSVDDDWSLEVLNTTANNVWRKQRQTFLVQLVQPLLCNGPGKDPQKDQQTNSQLPEFLVSKKENNLGLLGSCIRLLGAHMKFIRGCTMPRTDVSKIWNSIFPLFVFSESWDLAGGPRIMAPSSWPRTSRLLAQKFWVCHACVEMLSDSCQIVRLSG